MGVTTATGGLIGIGATAVVEEVRPLPHPDTKVQAATIIAFDNRFFICMPTARLYHAVKKSLRSLNHIFGHPSIDRLIALRCATSSMKHLLTGTHHRTIYISESEVPSFIPRWAGVRCHVASLHREQTRGPRFTRSIVTPSLRSPGQLLPSSVVKMTHESEAMWDVASTLPCLLQDIRSFRHILSRRLSLAVTMTHTVESPSPMSHPRTQSTLLRRDS